MWFEHKALGVFIAESMRVIWSHRLLLTKYYCMSDLENLFPAEHRYAYLEMLSLVNLVESRLQPLYKKYKITKIQYFILRILHRRYPKSHTISEIQSNLIFEKSDLSRLVERLEAKGMLHRRTNSIDGRKIDIYISEFGLSTINSMRPEIIRQVNYFFSNELSSEEAYVLWDILKRMKQSLIHTSSL